MLLNFDVERPMSAAALNFAMNADQILFLAAQKEISKDVPFVDDIYRVGTVCRVRQLLRQPGSKTVRVMVEGLARGRIENVTMDTPSLFAEIEPMPDAQEKPTVKTEALCRRCTALFSEYAQISGNIAPESVINIMASTDAAYVADFIAQNIYLKPEEKQKLLEELRPSRRLAALCRMLTRELTLLSIERDLNESTQEQMNRNQREYYLREQMKIIQSELGEETRLRSWRNTARRYAPCTWRRRRRKSCSKKSRGSPARASAPQRAASSAATLIPAWRYPGTPAQRRRLTLPARRRCWTRTTSASKRSRSASSSSSPCASSRLA